MHKYTYGKLPKSFYNFFKALSLPNRTKSYIVEKPKNDFLKQFPNFFLVNDWNGYPLKLKLNESHKSFKNALYSSLLSEYPAAVVCKSKSCTDCFPPVIYLDR